MKLVVKIKVFKKIRTRNWCKSSLRFNWFLIKSTVRTRPENMALKHYCVSPTLNGKFPYVEKTEVLFISESLTSILKTYRKGNSPGNSFEITCYYKWITDYKQTQLIAQLDSSQCKMAGTKLLVSQRFSMAL